MVDLVAVVTAAVVDTVVVVHAEPTAETVTDGLAAVTTVPGCKNLTVAVCGAEAVDVVTYTQSPKAKKTVMNYMTQPATPFKQSGSEEVLKRRKLTTKPRGRK